MKKIIKLVLLFFLGGVFGGLLEIGYQIVTRGNFVLGGFLYGPFRPIYGFGVLILYLLGKKVNKNPIFIFLISFVVCSIFEYATSYFLELVFNIKWWDYNDFYLNVNGRICIAVSLFWGLLGLLFIKLIIPGYDKFYNKLNEKHLSTFLIVFYILLLIDTIFSNIKYMSIM